ncbi:GntR family transcriptional regulator [Zhouia sp. PK063]|uniref:GntR family transcriptional regulator n=1 Tax=Zhouia sp. PK063 TaxID=3373602 RepID=UPI0037971A54
MKLFFDYIKELRDTRTYTKHEQLVQGVCNAVAAKHIKIGEMLPSVNTMIHELGFSRETVSRAYKELIERGIIMSKNRKGYYLINTNVGSTQKIALVFPEFTLEAQLLYKELYDLLEYNGTIEVFFYNEKADMLRQLLKNIHGNFSYYILDILPNVQTEILGSLANYNTNRFIFLNHFIPDFTGKAHQLSIDFNVSFYHVMKGLLHDLRKWDEIVLLESNLWSRFPEIPLSFQSLIHEEGLNGSIGFVRKTNDMLEKNICYLTAFDTTLGELLKELHLQELKLNEDIAIIGVGTNTVWENTTHGFSQVKFPIKPMAQQILKCITHKRKKHLLHKHLALEYSQGITF